MQARVPYSGLYYFEGKYFTNAQWCHYSQGRFYECMALNNISTANIHRKKIHKLSSFCKFSPSKITHYMVEAKTTKDTVMPALCRRCFARYVFNIPRSTCCICTTGTLPTKARISVVKGNIAIRTLINSFTFIRKNLTVVHSEAKILHMTVT